jgi:hypothetical protein
MCFAVEARKPACNARNQGRFWPEETNSNKDAARQLYQSGELEMCSVTVWSYRWKHVSVNVRDLAKGKHSLASESRKPDAEEEIKQR